MKEFWRLYSKNIGGVLGLAFIILVVVMAAIASLLYPTGPFTLTGSSYAQPFHDIFPLGTDSLGRDVAAGIVWGARVSLLVGFTTTVIAVFIGVVVGCLAGYFGGVIDSVLMRFTEIFQTIPSFIFGIVLVAIMSPSLYSIVIAIAVVTWPAVARLVRGEFLALRNREFVIAAVAMGMSNIRIILTQILPNTLSPIIVISSLMVATAILFEAGLSFLGLGDPNVMSWGFMIGAGRNAIRTAWWNSTFPGVAILLTVLAINLIGEGLNDALNPKLRDK